MLVFLLRAVVRRGLGGGDGGRIGAAKVGQHPPLGFVLGILCNGLVCLAVWLTYSARTTTDRILAIVPPVAAFVATGFEHSIANMYFIPVAMLIRVVAPGAFWDSIKHAPADYATVDVPGLIGNLVPVTLGNIVGGTLMVGAVYWLVYLRGRSAAPMSGPAWAQAVGQRPASSTPKKSTPRRAWPRLPAVPQLDHELRSAAPASVMLDTEGALKFLRHTGPMLSAAGFGVLLPDWARKARLGVKMTTRSRQAAGSGSAAEPKFNMADLVDFRYDLALGDQVLDADDLAELARLKIPLVRIRGQWVELDHRHLQAALKFLQRDRTGSMTAADAMLAGLRGVDETDDDLPVVGGPHHGRLRQQPGDQCHCGSRHGLSCWRSIRS